MTRLADKWLRRKAEQDFSRISSISISNPPKSDKTQDDFSKISRISISNPQKNDFDAERWQHEISRAINRAMQQDNGALAYCELFMPLLHRRYMKAANNLDAAYTAQDSKQIRGALREHDKAAEQSRKAAAQPLTADQLTPAECSRFCQAHLSDKAGECSYLNQLNGCTLWDAKNKRRSISDLPISPTRYLEGHQKENP
jgi:hypothetical protein